MVKVAQKSSMEKLLETSTMVGIPKVGDLVEGKVISVSKSEVRLDISGLTTGIVRSRELFDESGEYTGIKVDDLVQATVIELENENGEMELSLRRAGHRKAWDKLEDLRGKGGIVKVKIVDANKGGLMVKLGQVPGFLPVSQLTVEHYPRVEGGDKGRILELLKKFIGEFFEVKIITVDEVEEKLIVSERAAWEEQQHGKIEKYKAGAEVEGVVSGVVDFGCFVKFDDGLEGLVHISELAWQRIDNPHEVVKVGQRVKAKIINVEGSKISLSLRRLLDDPWKQVKEKYKVGDKVKGKVLKVNPFGLFVELDDEIHGLAHISELSDKPIQDASQVAKADDKIDFKIISIDPHDHRLGLSIKALKAKPRVKKTEDKESKDNKEDFIEKEDEAKDDEKTDQQEVNQLSNTNHKELKEEANKE
ncbi:MAG: S1 RNA-binding domain-containing protein [Patescibacteria group bacterium]